MLHPTEMSKCTKACLLQLLPNYKKPAVPYSPCDNQQDKIPASYSSPRKSAMSRASSILAELFGTQVPLCTCFSCFGTGKIPPDYRKSLKTMSRVSYWRPQVLLPRQTYRVVLKRSFQDYSQSLCDEVQLCSHCTTELMTHSS